MGRRESVSGVGRFRRAKVTLSVGPGDCVGCVWDKEWELGDSRVFLLVVNAVAVHSGSGSFRGLWLSRCCKLSGCKFRRCKFSTGAFCVQALELIFEASEEHFKHQNSLI